MAATIVIAPSAIVRIVWPKRYAGLGPVVALEVGEDRDERCRQAAGDDDREQQLGDLERGVERVELAVLEAIRLGQDAVADEPHDVAAEGQDRQHDRAARHETLEWRAQAGNGPGGGHAAGSLRSSTARRGVGVRQCDDRATALRRTISMDGPTPGVPRRRSGQWLSSTAADSCRARPEPPEPWPSAGRSRGSPRWHPTASRTSGRSGRCPTSATGSSGSTCRRASRTARSTTPRSAITLDDGTRLPGRHDGMGAFEGPDGNVLLVRNHEVNNPGPAFGDASQAYDPMAQSGTTTIEVTPQGEVVHAYTSLNGTQMNCSGGRMPWGAWVTCEETINGPDVGPDFTGVSNIPLTKPHGYIFEVPAGGQSTRQPITRAGRFAHEAVSFDPDEGILYLTEDNFGFPSGFYRYIPATNPMETGELDNEGQLQMLAVVGQPNLDLAIAQPKRATYEVEWVDIDDPGSDASRTRPGQTAPTTNDTAITYVGNQGRAKGAAYFSRLEGQVFEHGVVYFTSTQGGGPGGDLARADRRRLRQRDRPDLGLPTVVADAAARCTSRPARTRWTSRTTSRPARAGRSSCARTTSTTTSCAACRVAGSCGTSRSTGWSAS